MPLTQEQEDWVDRMSKKPALTGVGKDYLRRLVELSQGKCRWTGLPVLFDVQSGTPPTNPLYAEVDHREPGTNEVGHDIVCHRANDAKGQLPWRLWLESSITESFKEWIATLQHEWLKTGTLKAPDSLQK